MMMMMIIMMVKCSNSATTPSLISMLISFLILCSKAMATSTIGTGTGSGTVPALYVFGDSLVDSGNNNLLPTFAKANYLPYGVDFGRGPTGRFTNGRTIADFIAEFLGLPLIPPYLGLHSELSASGINYASGSCGILPETGKTTGKCLSIGEQIELFQTTIEQKILPRYGEDTANFWSYMARSVFIISIGSNDYINNYLLPIPGVRKYYSPQSFAQLLVQYLSGHLQRLYQMGARKILVFEIGPIGCIPSMARTTYHNGRCVEEMNQMAKLFNNQLDDMMKNLSSILQGSELILGRVHAIAYDAVINRSKYGFVDTSNPCCVTWENGTSACIPGVPACLDTKKRFFWDGFHLTEAVYRIIGGGCIHNPSICTPKTIKQLIAVV